MTIEKIRQISNVIQALENLIVQCGDDSLFGEVRDSAEDQLESMQGEIRFWIHQGKSGVLQ